MLCSYRVGSEPISVKMRYESTEVPFASLPPAYHDEYSYLLQAETIMPSKRMQPNLCDLVPMPLSVLSGQDQCWRRLFSWMVCAQPVPVEEATRLTINDPNKCSCPKPA